jgi:hypothetical protein
MTANRALAVNRIACLRSLRDRNRGAATFGPFRLPATEAKKFRYAVFRSARDCCRITADTSASQARRQLACSIARCSRYLWCWSRQLGIPTGRRTLGAAFEAGKAALSVEKAVADLPWAMLVVPQVAAARL